MMANFLLSGSGGFSFAGLAGMSLLMHGIYHINEPGKKLQRTCEIVSGIALLTFAISMVGTNSLANTNIVKKTEIPESALQFFHELVPSSKKK